MAPGVHAHGLDEPRLVDFAGHLASRGFAVLTVELPDLRRYRITPRSTDMIEDAASWLAASSGLAEDGRVGIIGISFAGGLGIVAAGRPSLHDRVAFVLSLGGHGDLSRTLRFLCTGLLPDGTQHPPHDYGVAIAVLAVVDRLVPAAQTESLRDGVLTFLEASALDPTDKTRAQVLFAQARQMEKEMPEPAATLMRHVNRRAVDALGPILLHNIPALAADPSLSPERSPAPAAPTYLLHGTSDNVIPAQESDVLARHLRGRTRVELLVTPLITHAEVRPSTDLGEVWKLVSFWRDVLDE
jgi:dienelactone hydrolase